MSVKFVTVGPYEGEFRDIARAIRDKDATAVERAARLLEPLVKDASTLVPIPSHNGKNSLIRDICLFLSEKTGIPTTDLLSTTRERKSMYEAKKELKEGKRDSLPLPEELMMTLNGIPPKGKIIVIDNVIASGTTLVAALNAIGREDACGAVLTDDTEYEKIF